MDEQTARETAKQLLNRRVGRWTVVDTKFSFGKSAVVLKATSNSTTAALKIYDPALTERFGGRPVQLERINRQLALRGHGHKNIIEIYDGGSCEVTGHLFLAMKWLDYPTVSDTLAAIPRERIWDIVEQLSSAARYLDSRELVHRDIKPSNIAISPDYAHLVLLDLGVIRPLGESELTEDDKPQFLATLRYSSPEYLFGEAEDGPDGWKALTFYQIGAVIHDVVMRHPLFDDAHPFARLVEAVRHTMPTIYAPDVPEEICILARNCLIKDPHSRLAAVTWDKFARPPAASPVDAAKERIRARAHAAAVSVKSEEDSNSALLRLQERILDTLETDIRAVSGDSMFPRYTLQHQSDMQTNNPSTFTLTFDADANKGLPDALDLTLELRFLDNQGPTIALACSASYRNHPLPVDPEAGRYTGLHNSSAVQQIILDFVILAMDIAQAQASREPPSPSTS